MTFFHSNFAGLLLAVFFMSTGCEEKQSQEGDWCGTKTTTKMVSGHAGIKREVTETQNIGCNNNLTCAENSCRPTCPERMEYECVDKDCVCVDRFAQSGMTCDKRECDAGLLCAWISNIDEPTQFCVDVQTLFCKENDDCESGVCRSNGLCADRPIGAPCQKTEQCIEGLCQSTLEKGKLCVFDR